MINVDSDSGHVKNELFKSVKKPIYSDSESNDSDFPSKSKIFKPRLSNTNRTNYSINQSDDSDNGESDAMLDILREKDDQIEKLQKNIVELENKMKEDKKVIEKSNNQIVKLSQQLKDVEKFHMQKTHDENNQAIVRAMNGG